MLLSGLTGLDLSATDKEGSEKRFRLSHFTAATGSYKIRKSLGMNALPDHQRHPVEAGGSYRANLRAAAVMTVVKCVYIWLVRWLQTAKCFL